MRCPACGTTNSPGQRFCGGCGVAIVGSNSETFASPPPRTPADGQFVPGQVLSSRYRMVGLLGRGGMGEVYRADDLKLGQPVALKFLPRDVETDPERRQRFLDEVRLSLRVTHPNVCRVFDLGDIDGRHFLSMEYVDGEDLASLLRRIGRLPEDKAIEISRQLCAGLAAAHDEGVLHRDLKPANIMIDGRGRAKITDFGLAGATVGVAGREAQAGTPQYMAPEQFDGRELSVRTDLYSLGLVLYELFTGKRAFDGRDLDELEAMHSSTPTAPGAVVSGLNPLVERAIMRCVDPDPARRPASAASLAASLPGEDPLAMALAAGETPSPEMVARSGGRGELSLRVAALYLVIGLLGLGFGWYYQGKYSLPSRVGLPRSPSELRASARAAIVAAGYASIPSGSQFGFSIDTDHADHVVNHDQSVTRWDNLATLRPSPMRFWYRESVSPISPVQNFQMVDHNNPPLIGPGMIRVFIDPAGRLQDFVAVPSDRPDTPGPWPEPDWSPLFASAGLNLGEWAVADAVWAPVVASDLRRAWIKDTIRIEAASFRGKPVWFVLIPEWRKAEQATGQPRSTADVVGSMIWMVVIISMVVGGGVIARRNVRLGRGDRQGALRLAGAFVFLGAVVEFCRLTGDPTRWLGVYAHNFGTHLYFGLLVWLFYLALEPYVRRFWPVTLVAWSRVLEGRWRDPLVGRHILLGAIAGAGFSLVIWAPEIVARWFQQAEPPPGATLVEPLLNVRMYLANFLFTIQSSFLIPVYWLLAVMGARLLFRRPWIAYSILLLLGALLFGGMAETWGQRVVSLMMPILVLLMLARLGLFAFVVAIMFSFWQHRPLTTDPESWYFTQSVATIAIFTGVAFFGFWTSLGGQKVFKDVI